MLDALVGMCFAILLSVTFDLRSIAGGDGLLNISPIPPTVDDDSLDELGLFILGPGAVTAPWRLLRDGGVARHGLEYDQFDGTSSQNNASLGINTNLVGCVACTSFIPLGGQYNGQRRSKAVKVKGILNAGTILARAGA